MPYFLKRANHGEPNPVQQDGCANRGAAEEESSAHFVANDDYRALLNVVEFIDPSALVERQVTDLVEVCGYADDLAGGLNGRPPRGLDQAAIVAVCRALGIRRRCAS